MSRYTASVRPLDNGDIGLWVHYDDRERTKAIPTSRWDAHLKCWRIREIFLLDAQQVVAELNGTTEAAPAALTDAFRTLFNALPPGLRKPVHRALARVLHPDQGGNETVMKALNEVVGSLTWT